MANNIQRFEAKDALIIALAKQNAREAISTTIELQQPDHNFLILADVNNSVSKDYGVFGLLPNPAEYEPDIVSDFPSVFIIDANRKIIWSYVGTDDHDRPNISQIISNLP